MIPVVLSLGSTLYFSVNRGCQPVNVGFYETFFTPCF